MNTIGAFLDLSAKLEKEAFLEQYGSAFLVTIEEQRGGIPSSLAPGGDFSSAAIVCQSPGGVRQASIAARAARVYQSLKRPGANTSPDILVGRSRDNDLWIDDAEVSKRHA